MKEIHKFIQEKLIINKDTDCHYDPNDLNNESEELFDTSSYEDDNDLGAEEYDSIINHVADLFEKNKAYGAFAIRGHTLTELKEKNIDVNRIKYELNRNSDELIDKLFTWKDQGYKLRLHHGHIELDCINSGSRVTWYIYGLAEDAFIHVEDYFDGEDYVKNLDFLYKPEMVVEIS